MRWCAHDNGSDYCGGWRNDALKRNLPKVGKHTRTRTWDYYWQSFWLATNPYAMKFPPLTSIVTPVK